MKAMKKIGAAALALAMLGTSMTSIAFADEAEESYDFGGVTVKVFGNQFNNIKPDAENNEVQLEAKAFVEEKYNIVLEYADANAEGWDGYNMGEVVQTTMSAGATFANILDVGPEGLAGMMVGGILSEITDDIDQLEVGSVYTDAVSWAGKCYGMTFDNIGDTYAMIYSRDQFAEWGIDETPTDKFMAGEWSYDDMRTYLSEKVKPNLPEGVYPMGIHFFHWQSMAGAANGAVAVSSEGKINVTEENYLESLSYYQNLMKDGLAYPVTYEFDEDGNPISSDNPIGADNMGTKIAITRCESWEFSGLQSKIGEWGIAMWPWGDDITCEGDYTTLSDNYATAQSYWGSCLVPADAEEQTGIAPIDLVKIAKDYYDYISPSGAEGRHNAWLAEQNGEEPAIGFEAGTSRSFCTVEDMELYDWAHTRVVFDWSKPFDDADICDIWSLSREIICYGNDARSTAESYYQAALAKAEEMNLILADAEEEVETEAEVETEDSTEE